MKKEKPLIKLSIEDQVDGPYSWEGDGCIVIVISHDPATGEISTMDTGLMGRVSDLDLITMLEYNLGKMQLTLEDEKLAAVDLLELISKLRQQNLPKTKGKHLVVPEHTTLQ